MMNLKKIFFVMISLVFIASPAFSNPPLKCPAVTAIQNVGLSGAEEFEQGKWVVSSVASNFDTSDVWAFYVSGVKARSYNEAVKKGAKALPSLAFVKGPYYIGFGLHECDYLSADDSLVTRAFSPPIDGYAH